MTMALYTAQEMLNISTNIKNLRKAKGETMEKFGKRFNSHKSLVNNWEKGKHAPQIGTLYKIASLANVSTNDFIDKIIEA